MPFVIAGAITIGLMLGLMGSGGSILTVPMLVYVVGHDGKVAIAESLAIVGGIAAATMLPYARSKLVNWRNVLFSDCPVWAVRILELGFPISSAVRFNSFCLRS